MIEKKPAMTSRYAPFLSLLISLAALPTLGAECSPLKSDPRDPHDNSVHIHMPGHYCLTQDVVQSSFLDIHAFTFKKPYGPLLDIRYDPRGEHRNPKTGQWERNVPLTDNDVFEVNLKGRWLKGKVNNLVGINNYGVIRNVHVHHGVIDMPGNESPNVGVGLTSNVGEIRVPTEKFGVSIFQSKFEDVAAAETVDGKPPAYSPSNSIVEHLTIEAGWRGVEMGGAHNILRHNTIKVDGHTAVFMAGPGSVIEDNTIVINGNGDAGPFDAPIKLRDAHGAIVRNNRIVYRGWFTKAPAAINLLDSTNVVIENNAVEGFKMLTRCKGECTFSDKGNSLK